MEDSMNLADDLKASLSDLGDFRCAYDADNAVLTAALTIGGYEYALAQHVTDDLIDYTPIFRGHFIEIKERLALENRTAL
jgi:hypothetical protein